MQVLIDNPDNALIGCARTSGAQFGPSLLESNLNKVLDLLHQ